MALLMMLGVWLLWQAAGERLGTAGYLVATAAIAAMVAAVLAVKITLARHPRRSTPRPGPGDDTPFRRPSS